MKRTDEGAAGGSTKKAQMQESVADVYDTNIRTFSKSITGGKHGSKSWKQLGVGSSSSYAKVKADSGESATLNGLLIATRA